MQGGVMKLSEILSQDKPSLSFEVFPPRTDVGMEKLCGENGVLEKLYTLNPDYISCTYGAGGTNVGKNLEVLDKIVKDGKTTGITHFTCIGNTKEGIREQLQTYLDHGTNHMLALRGDLPFEAIRKHLQSFLLCFGIADYGILLLFLFCNRINLPSSCNFDHIRSSSVAG